MSPELKFKHGSLVYNANGELSVKGKLPRLCFNYAEIIFALYPISVADGMPGLKQLQMVGDRFIAYDPELVYDEPEEPEEGIVY